MPHTSSWNRLQLRDRLSARSRFCPRPCSRRGWRVVRCPNSTTPSIIFFICAAVIGVTTRCRCAGRNTTGERLAVGRKLAGYDSRRRIYAVIGDGRDQRNGLQRGDADLLSHRDGADGDLRPVIHRLGETAGFTGQLDSGLLSETVVAGCSGRAAGRRASCPTLIAATSLECASASAMVTTPRLS